MTAREASRILRRSGWTRITAADRRKRTSAVWIRGSEHIALPDQPCRELSGPQQRRIKDLTKERRP